jgi:CubicO group peptidase (beta-lactamase class C family)
MLEQIHDLVTEQMRAWAVPGVSIGLLHRGQIQTATFGIASIATNQPVTPETLFQIGSISKVFTTTLLMTFVDAGDLALDDPVVKYLPELPLPDREAREAITFRHLVTHLGGFYGDRFDDHGPGDDALAKAIAAFRDLPQQTRPGELWTYCNAGFDLAGRVMEIIGGKRFEDLMRERVFAPLGMATTTYFASEAIRHPVAVGHEGNPGEVTISDPWAIPRRSNPAGGISTTPAELLRFVQKHLNDGELDDVRIISAESAREMRAKQTDAGPFESWGLGWGRVEFGAETAVRHSGATNGFTAGLIVMPDRQFALVILTNHDMGGNAHTMIIRESIERWFGLEWPGAPVISLPLAELESRSGTYTHRLADYCLRAVPDGFEVSVSRRNPFDNSEKPGKPFKLKPVGGDVYLAEGGGRDGSYADFIRNPDGSIRFLRLGGRLGYPQGSTSGG